MRDNDSVKNCKINLKNEGCKPVLMYSLDSQWFNNVSLNICSTNTILI